MLSRKQHSFSRYHFMRRIRVLALLSLICFLSFSRAALAQETEQEKYAGSTNVKAYVIAASEDIPEKDGEQPKDSEETDVKTGDESRIVFGAILLVMSGTVLLCGIRKRRLK